MLDEFYILQSVVFPFLRNMLREFVVAKRACHMWLLGEDAVFAPAVFGTDGLDEASLKRFKPAGVSE
jgi:hypothetical protein